MAPVEGLTSQAVALMVGDAIDVVLYQALDEGTGRRRVTEVLEVLKSGAVVAANGEVEFRLRMLARWDPLGMDWTFPERPSEALMAAIRLGGSVSGMSLGRNECQWRWFLPVQDETSH